MVRVRTTPTTPLAVYHTQAVNLRSKPCSHLACVSQQRKGASKLHDDTFAMCVYSYASFQHIDVRRRPSHFAHRESSRSMTTAHPICSASRLASLSFCMASNASITTAQSCDQSSVINRKFYLG
jgi:hypothetical protein